MKTTLDFNVQSGLSLAADFQSVPLEISRYSQLSLQVLFDFSGGATSTGSLSVEQSNNGVTWSVAPGSVQTIASTNTNVVYNVPTISARYMRVAYAFTSGLGGSCAIIGHATI
jgi:hypothetical protein